jgi:hypothetical protein
MTVGTAVAGAVFAGTRAVRVVAGAVHVTGSLRAVETAASTASAAAFGVGACARARIAVAVDVAGRGEAAKIAVALRTARAGAVAARAGALVVVALTIDVTRRLFAFEFARLARRAHARSVVAIVVVARRYRESRSEQEHRGDQAQRSRQVSSGPFLPRSFDVRCSPSSIVMSFSIAASFSRRSPSSY